MCDGTHRGYENECDNLKEGRRELVGLFHKFYKSLLEEEKFRLILKLFDS